MKGGENVYKQYRKKWFGRGKKSGGGEYMRRKGREIKKEQLAEVKPDITDRCSKPDAQEPKLRRERGDT